MLVSWLQQEKVLICLISPYFLLLSEGETDSNKIGLREHVFPFIHISLGYSCKDKIKSLHEFYFCKYLLFVFSLSFMIFLDTSEI